MDNNQQLKNTERHAFIATLHALYQNEHIRPQANEARKLADFIDSAVATDEQLARDEFGFSRVVLAVQSILLAVNEIGLRGHALTAFS